MSYTERFSEVHQLLASTYPASYASEQNTTFVNVANFHRVVVIITAGNIGTSLDADIEIATDSDATGLHTLKSITQLTEAGSDDNSTVVVEIRNEELTKPANASSSNYDWLRVETTPSGASIYGVQVWGVIPRFAPVSTTALDEVVA